MEETEDLLTILEQKLIASAVDIGQLNIIDFHRCNGIWHNHPVLAMQGISNLLVDKVLYTIFQCDLRQFPERDDFPARSHAGNHESLAQLYWNTFHELFQGELRFQNSPNFSGSFLDEESGSTIRFMSDTGRVSTSTFCLDVLPQMNRGDLWISLVSAQRHIVLEFLDDVGRKLKADVAARFRP